MPPITLTQLGAFIEGYGLKRDYVSWENISPNVKLAAIASEDQLFTDHNGFDWNALKKSLDADPKKKNKIAGTGASTISQQTAKNVFLWQGRSWVRKGLEVYFTFMIEKIWGKKRILETYMNVAEMGDGIFGIEEASQKYFNKSAVNLSRQEAALIAASLPNPRRYSVKPVSRYVAIRSGWIVRQMNNLQADPDIQKIVNPSKK